MKQYIINEETGEAREVYTCDGCGRIIEDIEDVVELGDHHLCPSCDDEYELCDVCGDLLTPDEAIVVEGRYGHVYVCEDCLERGDGTDYFRCSHCEDWYTWDELSMSDDHGTHICSSCSDVYYTCEECGCIIHEDDRYFGGDDEGCDYPICYTCFCNSQRTSVIHDYGYKPDPIFGSTDIDIDGSLVYHGTELMFGVELEVDKGCDRRKCSAAVAETTSRVYLKRDGSLTDSGFEIVSHPGTLAYHKEVMPWQEIMNICRSHGYKSHDAGSCGLHFHVGRDQLCTGEEGNFIAHHVVSKLILLVKRLNPFLMKVSRRHGSTRWCEPACPPKYYPNPEARTRDVNAYLAAVYKNSRSAGRYLMLNVQNNATVEFRFFRGTLKYDSFLAAMQLVSNLCLYARDHDLLQVLTATPDDVVNYVKYPELSEYIDAQCDLPLCDDALVETMTTGRPFRAGDFVVAVKTDAPEAGDIGLVVNVQNDGMPLLDVAWLNFFHGHDLGGDLENDLCSHGWRVREYMIRLATPEDLADIDFTPLTRNRNFFCGSPALV